MKTMMRIGISATLVSIVLLLSTAFVCNNDSALGSGPKLPIAPPYLTQETPLADSLIHTLSLEEQIGQLFMVAAYSSRGSDHEAALKKLINEEHIGGVIFFKGSPNAQVKMTNRLQGYSSIPLLVAMDAEWGPSMRLDSTVVYPRQMTLGAIRNEATVYAYGVEMARQLKRLGVHVSFSPVVDVNNNAQNPVIGSRSFGENRDRVSKMGIAYMKGLQSQNILANAKHFPGHGDTDTDSHLALPVINHSRARLDSIELYPFRGLIEEGLGSVMVAHLHIPALDSTPNLPTTLSKYVVDTLLKQDYGFEGLVFTDALNMKGVANQFAPGVADLKALMAGNDVLLFPEDVPKAAKMIAKAVADSLISADEIKAKCHKILKVKEWSGALEAKAISTQNLYADLNSNQAKHILQKSVEEAITTLNNYGNLIPLTRLDSTKIAVLNIGDLSENTFTKTLSKHIAFDAFSAPKQMNAAKRKSYADQLKEYDRVIINILSTSHYPKNNYGVSSDTEAFLREIMPYTQVMVNVYANPYALRSWEITGDIPALLVAYQDDAATQKAVAEILAGALGSTGRLPVSISTAYPEGFGLETKGGIRLKYGYPESLGLDSDLFLKIDSLAINGIQEKAYPGCRVLVVKDGVVILDNSYGHLTYEKRNAVTSETVYDLASITKIMASTPAMMSLHEQGDISMDYNLCDYIDLPDTSYYTNVNLKEMMAHTARLRSWIPFYINTLQEGDLDPSLYRKTAKAGFNTQVASGLYIKDSYVDSIYSTIFSTPLNQTRKYRYSDIGYYFIQRLVEERSCVNLENLVVDNYYRPIGLQTMGYRPLERIPKKIIAPTEYDMIFRKKLVHGYVHDPGAAMMGGVGGHAGIFSNAHDVAAMMQMYLDGGIYADRRLFLSSTIDYFTTCHYCYEQNRRGLGFDKPDPEPDAGPTCNDASPSSFGHSGFTGTLTWADPDHDLVYVFLSNRVYPNADNKKLIRMNIRTDIQQVIYDAIEANKKDGIALQ